MRDYTEIKRQHLSHSRNGAADSYNSVDLTTIG